MAYVDTINITSATSTGLIIASDAYFPDADCRRAEAKTDGVVENSYVRSGGELAIANANGYVENIHISNGGYAQIKGIRASASEIHVSQGGWMFIQGGAQLTDLYISSGGELRFYEGSVKNLTVESGGRVYKGTLTSNVARTMENLYVHSGAQLTLYSGFTLIGDINIASGALTNDLDASAANGTIYDLDLTSAGSFGSGVTLSRYTQTGCVVDILSGAAVKTATLNTNTTLNVLSGATVTDVTMADSLCTLNISSGAVGENITYNSGTFTVWSGGTAKNFYKIGGTGVLNCLKTGAVIDGGAVYAGTVQALSANQVTNATIRNLAIRDTGSAIVRGKTNLAEGIVVSGGALYIQSGAIGTDIILSGGEVSIRGLDADGVTHGTLQNATIYGGMLNLSSGGVVKDTTIVSGGSMVIYTGGITQGTLTFDFTGATTHTTGLVNNLTRVTADATVAVKFSEWGSSNRYRLATTGDASRIISVTDGSVSATLSSGGVITNPFAGVGYTWHGTSLVGGGHTTTVVDTAAAFSAATADSINDNDLSGKWGSSTAVATGNVYLAANMTEGTAWLEIDGYEGGADTTLYGASGTTFESGTVNILAKSGSLRNLAAGANAGGTVKAVNLTFAGAELGGTGYAGGFGNVTGKTATTITTGTFAKDFYAGALANKLTTATSVGDVSMTIDGGTFDGNIYGASAVKTDSTKGNGTRHTAGNVTLTVSGGASTKGNEACIFAGGYATGNATGTVYTVDSVSATISGGSWGEAKGGRGVFGGIMASGVEAQVLGNVNITISGDETTMGNVYGGGWAQKLGAKSIVGNVNINIAGGTIANVFGGGSHSTTGGTTETGDVTITVSGGNITGAIYARGQLDGDATGAASVIFTGSDGFDCDVYGYSRVGGDDAGATLNFNGYTGEFSGALGGFTGITLDGATAMTLDTAASDVSNGKWEFDLTDRASTLAETSLLTWSSASFTDDTIKVTFADDTQAQGGWNIATVAEAFSGTTFDVEVDGTEIASGLAYGGQIASGDYAGWGFELESGVLKFKNLASA